MEWVCENNDGVLITIYDWKENRPINNNENIKWHIGGRGIKDTLTAKLEILKLLIMGLLPGYLHHFIG